MFLQYLLVAVLVSVAAWYVARQTWRTWVRKPGQGCGGGCGCSSKAGSTPTAPAGQPLIPVEELTNRLRQRT